MWCERVAAPHLAHGLGMWQLNGIQFEQALVIPDSDMEGMVATGQLAAVSGLTEDACTVYFRPLPIRLDKVQSQAQFAMLDPVQGCDWLQLWELTSLIRHPMLVSLIVAVMTDQSIAPAFYRAQASQDYHHAYVGGLLQHSVEVASMAYQLSVTLGLSSTETSVALVASMLHDLGKIWLYYNCAQRVVIGQHEAYTFGLLGPHLSGLQAKAPCVFEALTACLVARVGAHPPQYLVETLVRQCDRLSAQAQHMKSAFADLPPHFYFTRSQTSSGSIILKRLL